MRDLCWTARDGLALHGRDYPAQGDTPRPIVVCLPGLTRNARDFDALATRLARHGHRVIAVDLRGRGASAWDEARRYTVPTYVEDVLALLDQHAIGHAIFIGTSLGGLVTMELAVTGGDRIAGAVINDVGPVLGAPGLRRIASYAGQPVEISTWQEAELYTASRNAVVFPDYGADQWASMARRLFRERDGRVTPDYDPAIIHPAEGLPPACEPWAAWAALIAAAPVLLLRGALSDLLEVDTALRMQAAGAGVSLAEVPGVGHAPMLDEPAAVAAIDAFLARLA